MFDDPGMEFLFRLVAVAGGVGFVVVYLVGFALWLAGQLSGVLAGHGWPDSRPGDVPHILRALALERRGVVDSWPVEAQPDLGPVWTIFAAFMVFMVILTYLVVMVVRLLLNLRRRRHRLGPLFRLGFASGFEVYRLLGRKALLAKAESLRPSLVGRRIRPEDVGFQIGVDRRSRQRVYTSCEDSLLVVGQPSRTRDVQLGVGLTIDAPGPCIVFTSDLDLFTSTYQARAAKGAVHVMDPLNFTRWPERLRWAPSRGCANPVAAHWRARKFLMWHMGSGGLALKQGGGAELFSGAVTALQCYLQAADLGRRTARDLIQWVHEPLNREPIDILRAAAGEGRGGPRWWSDLESVTVNANPHYRDMVSNLVRQALNSLEDPTVLDACSPPHEEQFNIGEFLRGPNTMYVIAKEDAGCRAVVLTMLTDVLNHARDYVTSLPGSRFDPPLTLVLNEVAVPLPLMDVPGFMSDFGGVNIATHVYLSSLSDGRRLWGAEGIAAIWDNTTHRIVKGGGGNTADLTALSGLMGKVNGKPVLTPEEIRIMKYNRAVLIAGAARPVELKLTPWWKRTDGRDIARSVTETEERIRRNSAAAQLAAQGLAAIEVRPMDELVSQSSGHGPPAGGWPAR